MKNNKGFTLVELLATMSILAVLMLLAIPNVIGIVQRNKNKAYIEDAKKLVTLAEYKIRSNPNVKPRIGESYCLYMNYLDKSKELDEPPNGGQYNRYRSYVKVQNNNGTIKYKVQLAETKDGIMPYDISPSLIVTGIKEVESGKLYEDDITSLIKNKPTVTCSGSKYYYDKDSNPSVTQVFS